MNSGFLSVGVGCNDMNDIDTTAAKKRRAGERATELVDEGDVVGLGTGSTAAYAIEALGERVASGLTIQGIPTSYQSRALALDAGITLTALDAVEHVDVAIDGADQVVEDVLVKGGGAAHTREKIVDSAAERFVVVIDDSKEMPWISHPVPVEVIASARSPVTDTLRDMGGEPVLRNAGKKDGPVITQHGNLVIDCDFGRVGDPTALAEELSMIPGVVEHGLFVDIGPTVVVGGPDGVEVRSGE